MMDKVHPKIGLYQNFKSLLNHWKSVFQQDLASWQTFKKKTDTFKETKYYILRRIKDSLYLTHTW